jgi:hypothetical protein
MKTVNNIDFNLRAACAEAIIFSAKELKNEAAGLGVIFEYKLPEYDGELTPPIETFGELMYSPPTLERLLTWTCRLFLRIQDPGPLGTDPLPA